MPILNARIATLVSIIASVALGGCVGNSGSPAPPPAGVQTYAGDGTISLTWNVVPGDEYWVFYAQDPTLSTSNWTTLLDAGALVNAGMPSILCNQINNPNPTSLFPQMFFTVDARTGSSPGGPGSSLVSASPRPAGGPASPWVIGPTIPANVTALGYGAISSCGYAGRPASGIYVAVGPGGTIYSSTVAPTVSGPLIPSEGNNPMTWTPGNIPLGFSQDLVAVAGYGTATTPTTPALIFVAVGAGGTILRSTDGQNWALVPSVPTTNNLNAVSYSGSAFIAVGDGGVILTSSNGLVWTQSLGAAVNTNTLNAIKCIGSNCFAVGASGATMWTNSSGASWTLFIHGTNNWTRIAYGNNNANADPPVVTQTDVTLTLNYAAKYISTWVLVDAQGNYAYTNSPGTWTDGNAPIANSIVAIDYTTRFVALDAAGNAYASENATSWVPIGASGLTAPTALFSNGQGFVALDVSGANASSF